MPVTNHRIATLRSQIADWNDLSLEMQLAALDVWKEYGHQAAVVYCLGA